MLLDASANGLYAIAPTPFDDDGRIDFHSLDRLCDFYEECGADGITILGVLGEAPKLGGDEALEIARHVLGRSPLPIIVGVSAPGFAAMSNLGRAAMDAGAAGVMVAPAGGLKIDEQIAGYFAQAAAALGHDTPFVIQDYPMVTGVTSSVATIAKIVADNPGCIMLKHEDWPGLEKISKLRELEQKGEMRHISILCGNGGLFLDFETERGADGAMTGYAFPDMLVELVKLAAAGDRTAAHDLFDSHLPLLRYEHQQGVGLAVRKYILKRRGILASDHQRAPRSVLSAAAKAEVDFLLERLAAKDSRAQMGAA
ncbi:dihydrodipicolinate synthase family protein [Qipengyuania sp. ASV99]|uniref:dihydrodipicolinate synthase family protein n=1 Tax=Qipengyuania sp. ASV99 TaxID=3399681 RepID=UPI003A4C7337